MDPLLEIELQQAADRQGISKSQFIIAAVERALGRKNPYELMVALQAEEPRVKYKSTRAPYDSVASKAALRRKLKAKHDAGSAG
jgi:RHH-type rel operon transcriptional repressor/antitoxin RelB